MSYQITSYRILSVANITEWLWYANTPQSQMYMAAVTVLDQFTIR